MPVNSFKKDLTFRVLPRVEDEETEQNLLFVADVIRRQAGFTKICFLVDFAERDKWRRLIHELGDKLSPAYQVTTPLTVRNDLRNHSDTLLVITKHASFSYDLLSWLQYFAGGVVVIPQGALADVRDKFPHFDLRLLAPKQPAFLR